MIKINFNDSSYDILPPLLRTITNFEFVQVLIKGLKEDYVDFESYVEDNAFELKHNSQVILFENYLNNRVPSSSGVTLTDGIWVDQLYVYFENEIDLPSKRLYLDFKNETIVPERYLYNQAEYDEDVVDFLINYHIGEITLNPTFIADMTPYADKMKIIGTTYRFNAK